MFMKRIPATEIEPGMMLCGDDGKPLGEVTRTRVSYAGGVRVLTLFGAVHYAPGGHAVVVIDD